MREKGFRTTFMEEEYSERNSHRLYGRTVVSSDVINSAAFQIDENWVRANYAVINGGLLRADSYIDGRGNYARIEAHVRQDFGTYAHLIELVSVSEEGLEAVATELGLPLDKEKVRNAELLNSFS